MCNFIIRYVSNGEAILIVEFDCEVYLDCAKGALARYRPE